VVKQNLISRVEDLNLKQKSMKKYPPIKTLTTLVKKYRILRNHRYLL